MTRIDWLKNKLVENELNYKLIQDTCYEEYCTIFNTSIALKAFKDTVKNAFNTLNAQKNKVDEEFDIENTIKLEKNLQKKSDINTYLKRNNRNNYRVQNEVESICEELIKRLDEVRFDIPKTNTVKEKKEKKTALLCLSDLHSGTLINGETEDVCYDYNILSRRLKKYVTKSIETMKKNDVTNVIVCGLGDFVSSPRRTDELLGQVSSTTNSLLVIITIIEQILVELCNNFEKVVYTSVIGNESRLSFDWGNHSIEQMQNFDFLQFTILHHILNGKIKNLEFMIPKNPLKHLIEVPIDNGTYNICIAHGNMIKNTKDDCEKVYTTSYLEEGKKVDLTILGHFHHLNVLSSGKLITVGTTMRNNCYALNTIGTKGHAFQDLILIQNDGSYWHCPIKLDDVSDFIEGYKIQDELNLFTYNESKVDKVNIDISYN